MSFPRTYLMRFGQGAWGPPPRIIRRDFPDQLPDFLDDRRPARVPQADAGPVVLKACALLAEQVRRQHENQDFPPVGPALGQARPQDHIAGLHVRPPARSARHRRLMLQGEDLHLEGSPRPEEAGDEREQGTNEGGPNKASEIF